MTELHTLTTRFRALYTGAVADVLDAAGYRQQVLPPVITPLTLAMKVAGPAFPGRGAPTDDITHDDTASRLAMLESTPAGSVAVWSCGGHEGSAHWGEIMTRAVMERGSVGAVIDGGLRDTEFLLHLGFPVFSRFRSSASSIGRWDILEWNCQIRVGQTTISPGDWVVGDADGVVVIPADTLEEVLAAAEDKARREEVMRRDLATGAKPSDIFKRLGSF
ncbi:MAG: RraA family protein [Actinomycetota bacterium]